MTLIGAVIGGVAGAIIGIIAVLIAKLAIGNDDDYRAFARNAPLGFIGIGVLVGAIVGELMG